MLTQSTQGDMHPAPTVLTTYSASIDTFNHSDQWPHIPDHLYCQQVHSFMESTQRDMNLPADASTTRFARTDMSNLPDQWPQIPENRFFQREGMPVYSPMNGSRNCDLSYGLWNEALHPYMPARTMASRPDDIRVSSVSMGHTAGTPSQIEGPSQPPRNKTQRAIRQKGLRKRAKAKQEEASLAAAATVGGLQSLAQHLEEGSQADGSLNAASVIELPQLL
jgi:hypothetical protein